MTKNKPTFMVIDGHSLAFRAFYALPVDNFMTETGQHTNAIHGFVSMLLSLLKSEKPDALAIAFDISRYSFRTKLYEDYKGTRGETPAEFKGQIPLLRQVLKAMNIITLEKEDYEADDIVATFATEASNNGFKVLVVSGDRDTIQLVNEDVTLLYPASQGVSKLKRYTPETVFERYGVEPYQYPDVAALVGETSDNLPGVPRVGEKTAVKWLNQFGSLEEIVANQDKISGKVGESLRENYHLALRNRNLNALIRDLDLPVTLDDCSLTTVNEDAVKKIFAMLQFRSLLSRVLDLSKDLFGSITDSVNDLSSVSATAELLGLGSDALESDFGDTLQPPQAIKLVDEELSDWIDKHRTAEDFTSWGVSISYDSLNNLYSVALSNGTATVLADVTDSSFASVANNTKSFNDLFASNDKLWFWSVKEDFHFLKQSNLIQNYFDVKSYDDVSIISALLDKKYASSGVFQAMIEEFSLNYEPSNDRTGNDLFNDGDYHNELAWKAWAVKTLGDFLNDQLLLKDSGGANLYADIERPLIPVLANMENTGFAVDSDSFVSFSDELTDKISRITSLAYSHIKKEINLASPKQLQEVLFDELNMPKTRKTKTGYSTDAAALAELQQQHPHPFIDALLEHREASKLKQIAEILVNSVKPDGRIHSTFVQMGAATGRLASTDPNVQNIPVKTNEGRKLREAFIKGSEYDCLLTADYSQIEMRIMAHLSGDNDLISAFIGGEDLHSYVGSKIFHVPVDQVDSLMRTKVKAMSYGLVYGLSAYGLARQLTISPSEAKQLMADYFDRFGAVRQYLRSVVDNAKNDGFTTTILGRRRYFSDLKSPNRVLRENAQRAALNAPIQGSAADIMKLAMININNELFANNLKSRMLLQVHDEIILEAVASEIDIVKNILHTCMENVVSLKVPLQVNIGIGSNWNEAAH